jgi:hypothetical protein
MERFRSLDNYPTIKNPRKIFNNYLTRVSSILAESLNVLALASALTSISASNLQPFRLDPLGRDTPLWFRSPLDTSKRKQEEGTSSEGYTAAGDDPHIKRAAISEKD